MTRTRVAFATAMVASCVGCRPGSQGAPGNSQPSAAIAVDVRLQSDEADAALAILRRRLTHEPIPESDWGRLFATAGYQHLLERERSMHRPIGDSAFRAFLLSDSMLARARALDSAATALETVDVSAAAARAIAYLPAGTPLRARMYLEIKPAPNTFVFTGRDSVPSIFLYVRPHESPGQLENTLAHELHHIGMNAACGHQSLAGVTPAERTLLLYLGAFGEGEAMLAAAGSPSVNPHLVDDDSIQQRWTRDVARAPSEIADLSTFFDSVVSHRDTSADSVERRARTYYGVQGPWYTVGWLMASTVEQAFGRQRLVDELCDPARLLRTYDDAATALDPGGTRLPRWDDRLVSRLIELRARAH